MYMAIDKPIVVGETQVLRTKAKETKARVFILYTGGTIGMAPESEVPGSPLVPRPLVGTGKMKGLLDYLPDSVRRLGIDFAFQPFEPPLDSSNLRREHWVEMAKRIEIAYHKGYDGFIILHGTDTMSYTSSALAFMLENLDRPVVITGSQLPISDPRTDALMNLANAIYVAGYKAVQLDLIPEVVILFADKVLRGCRARKVSSNSIAGFDSPNYPPLGLVGEHIQINKQWVALPPAPGAAFQIDTSFAQSKSVMDISIFPGFDSDHLKEILNLKDVKGIVLRTFGAGNAPDDPKFLSVIENAVGENGAGKTIVNTSQCLEGMVEMGLYASSSGLLERGVISALDMTPEAVMTKLMWTLGTKLGPQVVAQMQVNQRGEQSQNLFDLRYGACGTKSDPMSSFRQYRTPDRRFNKSKLIRAVVRFSKLGISGVTQEGSAGIQVYLNHSEASWVPDGKHPRCVANFPVVWKDVELNLAEEIDKIKTLSAAGDGDLTLTVVPEPGVSFWFSGLYLALFTEA